MIKDEEIPNLQTLRDLANKIDEEYNIELRLKQYASTSPELLEFSSERGLNDPEIAASAMFVSDYLITASNVPASSDTEGTSDDERRESIIASFISGLSNRTTSAIALMRVFYLSLKTAALIKQNDLFMAGRGLERKTTLLILKDGILIAYLKVSSEILGLGSASWELGILSAVLRHQYPHKELLEYEGAPDYTDFSGLLPYIWKLFDSYAKFQSVTKNDDLVIPNIEKSKILLISQPGKYPLVSLWKSEDNDRHQPSKEDDKVIEPFLAFFNKADTDKQFVYLRGRVVNTTDQLMIIRNPAVDSNPLTLIQTPANEINLSEQLAILTQRGLEAQGWEKEKLEKLEKTRRERKQKEKERKQKEKERKQKEKERKQKEKERKQKEREQKQKAKKRLEKQAVKSSTVSPKKKSFLSKIFGRFSKPSETPDLTTVSIPQLEVDSDPELVEKSFIQSKEADIVGEPSEITTTVESDIESTEAVIHEDDLFIQESNVLYLPSFLSHGIGIEAVWDDLNLFEIFDTARESENGYLISGAFESDYRNSKTIFITKSTFDPAELENLLDGLNTVVEQVMNLYFGGPVKINLSEILFYTSSDNKYIVCFDGNDEKLVGIIAGSFFKSISTDSYKRRTIQMRTNQLLGAVRHTPFDEAVTRILGDIFGDFPKIKTIDHPILPLKQLSSDILKQ